MHKVWKEHCCNAADKVRSPPPGLNPYSPIPVQPSRVNPGGQDWGDAPSLSSSARHVQ